MHVLWGRVLFRVVDANDPARSCNDKLISPSGGTGPITFVLRYKCVRSKGIALDLFWGIAIIESQTRHRRS